MALAANGYIRRLTRRLTEDIDQLDAEELAQSLQATGAQRACDCRHGEEVTMRGRLRSVESCAQSANASMRSVSVVYVNGISATYVRFRERTAHGNVDPSARTATAGTRAREGSPTRLSMIGSAPRDQRVSDVCL